MVIHATFKYDDPQLKMLHLGCTLVQHFYLGFIIFECHMMNVSVVDYTTLHCYTWAVPLCDIFDLGSSYLNVTLTTMRHLYNVSVCAHKSRILGVSSVYCVMPVHIAVTLSSPIDGIKFCVLFIICDSIL